MKLILTFTIVAAVTLSLAVSPLKERKDQDHTHDEKSGFWLSILLTPHCYGVRNRADSMKKIFLGTESDQRKLIEAPPGSYLSAMEKQNAEEKGRRQSKSWVEGPPAPVMDAGGKSWMEEPQGPPRHSYLNALEKLRKSKSLIEGPPGPPAPYADEAKRPLGPHGYLLNAMNSGSKSFIEKPLMSVMEKQNGEEKGRRQSMRKSWVVQGPLGSPGPYSNARENQNCEEKDCGKSKLSAEQKGPYHHPPGIHPEATPKLSTIERGCHQGDSVVVVPSPGPPDSRETRSSEEEAENLNGQHQDDIWMEGPPGPPGASDLHLHFPIIVPELTPKLAAEEKGCRQSDSVLLGPSPQPPGPSSAQQKLDAPEKQSAEEKVEETSE